MTSSAVRYALAIVIGASILCLASCDGEGPRRHAYELSGPTMGTTYNITVVSPPEIPNLESIRTEVNDALSELVSSMSTYREDSELSLFNKQRDTDWHEVSPELCKTVQDAISVSRLSDGAFDVTIAAVVNLWSFGPDTGATGTPSADQIKAALLESGYQHLFVDCKRLLLRKDLPGISIDLSGIAKGFAVDQMARILLKHGLTDFLVEIGGELRMSGRNPHGNNWAIAIEAPERFRRDVETIVETTDVGVATSGDYRNFFEDKGKFYSHIIDPLTGYPIDHATASVTVVAQSTAMADALATALLVMGAERGLELAERENIAALFLVRDGTGITERRSSRFAFGANRDGP